MWVVLKNVASRRFQVARECERRAMPSYPQFLWMSDLSSRWLSAFVCLKRSWRHGALNQCLLIVKPWMIG